VASLTITIGALTGTLTATDAKATEVVGNYADAIGATGTNQERLQAVLRELAQHMVTVGSAYVELASVSEARESARANAPKWE
jgi:hypothetical protein